MKIYVEVKINRNFGWYSNDHWRSFISITRRHRNRVQKLKHFWINYSHIGVSRISHCDYFQWKEKVHLMQCVRHAAQLKTRQLAIPVFLPRKALKEENTPARNAGMFVSIGALQKAGRWQIDKWICDMMKNRKLIEFIASTFFSTFRQIFHLNNSNSFIMVLYSECVEASARTHGHKWKKRRENWEQ